MRLRMAFPILSRKKLAGGAVAGGKGANQLRRRENEKLCRGIESNDRGRV